MSKTEDYIIECCVECLIGARNCLLYKHIESIEDILRPKGDTVFNGMGDCKIQKAISIELRSWMKIGGSSK